MIAANIMMKAQRALSPGQTVFDALCLMRETGAKSIPVVDGDNRIAGVVTSASVMVAIRRICGADDGVSGLMGIFSGTGPIAGVPVEDAMEASVDAVLPDADMGRLLSVFSGGGKCVFVVDNHKRLLGVITPEDVLRRLWEYSKKAT